MGFQWSRLDNNIWSHDKTLALLEHGAAGHKAMNLYIFGIAYASGHGTDGLISRGALKKMEFTRSSADLLVRERFWDHAENGAYMIRNYSDRNPIKLDDVVTSQLAKISICVRWMRSGKPCSCGTHLGPGAGAEA